MKKIIWLLFLFTGGVQVTSFAQNIGINSDGSAPNPNAMLDIKAFNKGLLIPRTSSISRTSIPNTKGLLVYDTTSNSFWYNNGSVWNNLAGGGTGWSLTGNSGTDTSSNFIGTTDAKPLLIKVDNNYAGLIDYDPSNGNTGLGYETFFSNTTGHFNTEIGYQSLVSNTTGNANSANGYQTLWSNTTGSFNTANGFQALSSNTTGTYNTATGVIALGANTTGTYNTANGAQALFANTTGAQNTAIGYQSLDHNIDGVSNTAVGYQSMLVNTSGYQNTAIGNNSMQLNTTGGYNVAAGLSALQNNTTGSSNTAVGQRCMYLNTSGGNNTAVGFNSLYSNTTGTENVTFGDHAGYNNTTGSNNIFIGRNAGSGSSTGNNNICIGPLASVTDGVSNSIVIGSLIATSQSNAIILGTGSQNVGIGTAAPSSNAALEVDGGTSRYSIYAVCHSNFGAINATVDQGGAYGISGSSNGATSLSGNVGVYGYAQGSTLQEASIGGSGPHTANFGIYGQAYIPSQGNPGFAAGFYGDIETTGNVYAASDEKLKTNIKQLANALSRLQQLPVKEYDFDKNLANPSKLSLPVTHQFGFLAQDVQGIFPNLVTSVTVPRVEHSINGSQPKVFGTTSFLAVNYMSFIPLLTKAIQELSAENEALKNKLDELTMKVDALSRK